MQRDHYRYLSWSVREGREAPTPMRTNGTRYQETDHTKLTIVAMQWRLAIWGLKLLSVQTAKAIMGP